MELLVQIKKKLDSFLLDVSFEAGREVLALLGASGCGKSMTLKCIAGIETPEEGRIVLDGAVLFDSEQKINLPPQKRRVGYLFQDYALFPSMTVEQNILSALGRGKSREKAGYYIKQYHLEGMERYYPGQLSGGQKQRAAMARLMAAGPKLVLLDEPFAALDSYLKEGMLREMKEELKNLDIPAVFVSHDRDEVFAMSRTVCSMVSGKTEPAVEKRKFFEAPESVSAAVLSGCKNISPVRFLDEEHLLAQDWGIILFCQNVPPGIKAVGIRAHDFMPAGEDGLADENHGTCESLFPVNNIRVEERLFEWDVFFRAKAECGEILWKVPKKLNETVENIVIPTSLKVMRDRILFLR